MDRVNPVLQENLRSIKLLLLVIINWLEDPIPEMTDPKKRKYLLEQMRVEARSIETLPDVEEPEK